MSVLDKANKYIGHPEEIDEGFEVSMRRDAYVQGYKDAIDAACKWIIEHTTIDYSGDNDLEALKLCHECATEIVETFRKVVEE